MTNEILHAQTTKTIEGVASAAEGGREGIDERLCQLEQEWSSRRLGRVVAGALIGAGIGLRRFPILQKSLLMLGGGLLAHSLLTTRGALDGLFEIVGARPRCEIERERLALRTLPATFRPCQRFTTSRTVRRSIAWRARVASFVNRRNPRLVCRTPFKRCSKSLAVRDVSQAPALLAG